MNNNNILVVVYRFTDHKIILYSIQEKFQSIYDFVSVIFFKSIVTINHVIILENIERLFNSCFNVLERKIKVMEFFNVCSFHTVT